MAGNKTKVQKTTAPATPAEDNNMAQATQTTAGFAIKKTPMEKVTFAVAATLGEAVSKYEALLDAVAGMKPGDPAVILVPNEGEDAKKLRNRITQTVRNKAQPLAGGKLRIRLTTEPAGCVAIICEEFAAEPEAAAE